MDIENHVEIQLTVWRTSEKGRRMIKKAAKMDLEQM